LDRKGIRKNEKNEKPFGFSFLILRGFGMDITHFYREQGEGKPLVLLHGNGEDSSYFVHQLEHYGKMRRVIAIDTRGHGQTPRGNAPFTIRQFAEDLYEFLQEHGLEKVDLLGFSDGGNIAMIFAMNHPEMVDKLILNGANLTGRGVKSRVQIPIIIGYYVARLFAKRSKEAKAHAELLGLMVKDPNISVEELKKITAPTLVIAGSNDMIRQRHTELIGRSIPNGKTIIIEGNHFIANENANGFHRVVDEFLKFGEEDAK